MRKHTPIQPAKNILEQTASNATYATDMECEENGFDTNEQSMEKTHMFSFFASLFLSFSLSRFLLSANVLPLAL